MLTNKLTGAGAADKTYIEDVFSTYLYTGNGSTQTINNGIDLAGKGGMTWIQARSGTNVATGYNFVFDTERKYPSTGVPYFLNTADAAGQGLNNDMISSFNSSGFALGPQSFVNGTSTNYASWTFRKAPKFFDVVTFTETGSNTTAIPHSLGVVPGMIIVKRTDGTNSWYVKHRGTANGLDGNSLTMQSTAAAGTYSMPSSTATTFDASWFTSGVGTTYVAYLFAHDTTTDGLIQCGSYTGNGSATGPTITLGWEPQWLMIKNATGTGNWQIIDNMRGMPVGSSDATLQANLSNAESSVDYVSPTATGFQVTSTSTEVNTSGSTYIYMAIRRGPMRTPTDGTKVFYPRQNAGSFNADADFNNSEQADLFIYRPYRSATTTPAWLFADRLRGYPDSGYPILDSSSTAAEVSRTTDPYIYNITYSFGKLRNFIPASGSCLFQFKRAPGFFDVVCYTGTGAARTVNHNLGVAPELIIVKARSANGWNWNVYNQTLGINKYLRLNSTDAQWTISNFWGSSSPTSTVFSLSLDGEINLSGATYVAYLFASCPGVSKVGSYTGNGSTQNIDCGFTNGARFVLIKRTDSTGYDWRVWDTARGIVAGNDPFLCLNNTDAENTSNDFIDPYAAGFTIATGTAALNASGGTYIYLAIA